MRGLLKRMAERKKIDVQTEAPEIPFCYGLRARVADKVIGADALPEMLAKFGCVARCENCLVKQGVEAGLDTVSGIIDDVGMGVARVVSRLHIFSRGEDKIG